MIALDTNVVVRFLVADDARQAGRAVQLLNSQDCFLPKTVLLETDWVLRSRYGKSPTEVAAGLTALVALERVRVEAVSEVMQALTWAATGMELADALHLAATPRGASFATFDEDLIRLARKIGDTPEVAQP